MNKVSKSSFRYRGLTLVELLVVVSILVIVTAFTIPRLRVINKDRNMREAARIVGSAFSKASNRAIVEKSAGLLIERNPNYLDGSNVYFAGTRIFTLRALPPFGGDSEFDPTLSGVASNGANVIAPAPGFPNTMSVSVLTPLEHTSTNPMIQINDRIRLNYSSVTYLIVGVDPLPSGRLQLHLSLGLSGQAVMPSFPLTGATAPGLPYVVYRQPRKLQSSQTDLPDGYVIDLRYSGPMGLTSAG
ncbi:MAG: prepilin-type N-terminal cleavage/methylation domain-containing protein, partial [Mariniblastus sp.]